MQLTTTITRDAAQHFVASAAGAARWAHTADDDAFQAAIRRANAMTEVQAVDVPDGADRDRGLEVDFEAARTVVLLALAEELTRRNHFQLLVERHDLTFEYSDDGAVWRRGRAEHQALAAYAEAYLDPAVARAIWDASVRTRVVDPRLFPWEAVR